MKRDNGYDGPLRFPRAQREVRIGRRSEIVGGTAGHAASIILSIGLLGGEFIQMDVGERATETKQGNNNEKS
jgi:hypothetical protein